MKLNTHDALKTEDNIISHEFQNHSNAAPIHSQDYRRLKNK